MNHKLTPSIEKTLSSNSLPNHLGSFIWHFLKPYKQLVILFILMALLAGFWGPFNSLLLKSFINTLAAKSTLDLSVLYWIAGLLVFNFVLFDNVTWRTLMYLNYKYEAVIKNQIISQTFHYVMGASHQFFRIIYRDELPIKLKR